MNEKKSKRNKLQKKKKKMNTKTSRMFRENPFFSAVGLVLRLNGAHDQKYELQMRENGQSQDEQMHFSVDGDVCRCLCVYEKIFKNYERPYKVMMKNKRPNSCCHSAPDI